jgi:hypothetical protein
MMESSANRTAVWPLRFSHRTPVFGNGYVALVEFSGRLLARSEVDGIWIDGVNPGAFSVGAKTLADAGKAIRDALAGVLIDYAADTKTFDEFRAAVTTFFDTTDSQSEDEWRTAVEDVRAHRVAAPAGLKVESADGEIGVSVTSLQLQHTTTEDNPPASSELAAAA